ncbi:MAG: toll/interleukin-1 receptor domain-containing protein [Anaerolineae bacterium]|nr:toll/interleukin-1 receptor domain-containing protein [Anaerolineae bacterium]
MLAMGHVFISYSHKDKEFVDKLVSDLGQAGISAWVDYLNIHAGQDWQEELQHALRNAEVVLFVASQHSTARPYIASELKEALSSSITVIPLIVDDGGAARLPRILAGLDALDFRADYSAALQQLYTRLPVPVERKREVFAQNVPAQPQVKGYVFVSYAQEDTAFVAKLREFLRERGYAYWDYQDSDRDYHTQLALELEGVIREARATLSILSPDWKLSKWAAKEYLFSEEIGTPVFLLMARPMEPTLVIAGVPYIDFTRDEAQGFAKLDRELRRKGLIT